MESTNGLKDTIILAQDAKPVIWKEVGLVDKLYVYPIKSCKGISLEDAQATDCGLQHGATKDRQFLVTDKNGRFVTARKYPKLVLIAAEVAENGAHITLSAPGETAIRVALNECIQVETKVWDDACQGFDQGSEVGKWLSKYVLGDPNAGLKLLWHGRGSDSTRPEQIPDNFAPFVKPNDRPYYADGFPYLLLSQDSIDDLNKKLVESSIDLVVEEQRFRPNILVKDIGNPFSEDTWTYVKIGSEAIFRNVQLCSRCSFTTIDPVQGQKDGRMQPLKTLREYRLALDPVEKKKYGTSPFFGVNLGLETPGLVRQGDKVFIGSN